jgi:hypothetical protein
MVAGGLCKAHFPREGYGTWRKRLVEAFRGFRSWAKRPQEFRTTSFAQPSQNWFWQFPTPQIPGRLLETVSNTVQTLSVSNMSLAQRFPVFCPKPNQWLSETDIQKYPLSEMSETVQNYKQHTKPSSCALHSMCKQ